MARTPRYRERIHKYGPTGDAAYYIGTYLINFTQGTPAFKEKCWDTTGPRDQDGDLVIEKFDGVYPNVSGGYHNGVHHEWTAIWPVVDASNMQYFWNHTPPLPNWDILAAKALANANPNRPKVDLPLFLFELRDLPRMLKHIGEIKLGRVRALNPAELNLAYQFGWAPLLRDLWSLVTFSEAIAERVRYLRNLESGYVVRRRLGSAPIYTIGSLYTLGIIYSSMKGRPVFSGEESYWYSLRIKLLSDLPSSLTELEATAAKAALGIENPSFALIWEAMPWSWLIDWFSNFGDLLSLTRGNIRYEAERLNLMAKCDCSVSLADVTLAAGHTLDMGSFRYTRKLREARVPAAAPAFHFPLLDRGQWSIVGSLAILRALGRRTPAR